MSPSNASRFLAWRYREAYEMLQDPATYHQGSFVLSELLEDRAGLGPWLRLKCCVLLSFHAMTIREARDLVNEAQQLYDILSNLPPETLTEKMKDKLALTPKSLTRSREKIAQQLQALRAADRAERGETKATDTDDSQSDKSSDEDYIDTLLPGFDPAEHSSAENDAPTLTTDAPDGGREPALEVERGTICLPLR